MTASGAAMEQMTETRSGALAILAQQGALLRRNLREPITIESRRIAIERMITLDFPHCGAFFAEYSSNISMTGMFIRTDRIQPPGTVAAFEFNIGDGLSLISGEAEVVWVRGRHEGPDRPAGLGLRFVRLDKECRELIRRAVEKRSRDSGSSSEVEAPPAEASTPIDGGDAEAPPVVEAAPMPRHSYAGARAVQSTGGRWRWVVYAALAGLLAGALSFLYQGGAPEVAAAGVGQATAASAEEAATAVAERSRRGAAATEIEPSPAEVVDTVVAWAEAWSMQRVDTYLSFYAESYQPPGAMSFTQWSALRRDRISGPRRIEVAITDLEVQLLGAERAWARFQQSYASDRYRDSSRKILGLVLERGQWRIHEERSER